MAVPRAGKGPSEPFKEWSFWGREVPVGNPANQPDFTVSGATGSGPAGGQVLLDPGWQIKGTGSVATTALDDNVVETEFVLPPGPRGSPGVRRDRRLGQGDLQDRAVGQARYVPRRVPVQGRPGPGQLKIADIDRDLGNNTAGLTITVTAAGKPQPGPSTSASTTPSASASASASTAPGAGNAPGPKGGSGGNLYAMARRRRSA
ncbi:hypothetical protein [Streptomyces virginiae]|uniref:hypothetical protein n=1 Tax=Streptomyces virginiae TaxID=1961 RepID=UPI0036E279A2